MGGTPRTPPHDLAAEAALLGAMLLSADAIAPAAELVTGSDFYKPSNGHIFDAVLALNARADPVDPITLAAELEARGHLEHAGGPAALVTLQTAAPSTTSAPKYARIVADSAALRRLVNVGHEIVEDGFTLPDPDAAIERAERHLAGVAAARQRLSDIRTAADGYLDMLDRLERQQAAGGRMLGLATGHVDLDRLLLGLEPGNLIVAGARPAQGKTAWALGVAAHVAVVQKLPTLFVSLEMGELEVQQRLCAQLGRVDVQRLRDADLGTGDWAKINHVAGLVADAPLVIDTAGGLTVPALRARARKVRQKYGSLALVVVDYLQLMVSGRGENRQVEVADIARGLKTLAVDLQVPVIALAQVSRGVEARTEKRPGLADLRESGQLEADASVVLFLYRDEVYHPDSPDRGMAEVIVAKNRQGPTGTVRLAWLQHFTKFADMARSTFADPGPGPDF